jgi:hypothetical protein
MQLERLLEAINFAGVVSGLTHDFYRYPARFSPLVARAAIECFTEPGDTILDPFSGGATSLVEGLALGRHAVGMDISRLAVFLANVKTLLLDQDDTGPATCRSGCSRWPGVSCSRPSNGPWTARNACRPRPTSEVDPILWTKNGPSLATLAPTFLTGNP